MTDQSSTTRRRHAKRNEKRSKNGAINEALVSKTSEMRKLPRSDVKIDKFHLVSTIGIGTDTKIVLGQFKPNGVYCAIKAVKKQFVLLEKSKRCDKLIREKRIMESLTNTEFPFIVKLLTCTQSPDHTFFIMEYVPGGDLFTYFHYRTISDRQCRFYAACTTLAIEFLHSRNIAHRDLKSENILLAADGYAKLADFGLSKFGMGPSDLTHTICGTRAYFAPEMVLKAGYTRAIDWWCIGVFIYETVFKKMPFPDIRSDLFRRILKNEPDFPKNSPKDLVSFIQSLLKKKPDERLGSGPQGSEDVKRHKYFAHMNWEKLLRKELKPPFLPNLQSIEDVCNFDISFTLEEPRFSSNESEEPISEADQMVFAEFDFNGFADQ